MKFCATFLSGATTVFTAVATIVMIIAVCTPSWRYLQAADDGRPAKQGLWQTCHGGTFEFKECTLLVQVNTGKYLKHMSYPWTRRSSSLLEMTPCLEISNCIYKFKKKSVTYFWIGNTLDNRQSISTLHQSFFSTFSTSLVERCPRTRHCSLCWISACIWCQLEAKIWQSD